MAAMAVAVNGDKGPSIRSRRCPVNSRRSASAVLDETPHAGLWNFYIAPYGRTLCMPRSPNDQTSRDHHTQTGDRDKQRAITRIAPTFAHPVHCRKRRPGAAKTLKAKPAEADNRQLGRLFQRLKLSGQVFKKAPNGIHASE
jgi:hypothetical protein